MKIRTNINLDDGLKKKLKKKAKKLGLSASQVIEKLIRCYLSRLDK